MKETRRGSFLNVLAGEMPPIKGIVMGFSRISCHRTKKKRELVDCDEVNCPGEHAGVLVPGRCSNCPETEMNIYILVLPLLSQT